MIKDKHIRINSLHTALRRVLRKYAVCMRYTTLFDKKRPNIKVRPNL
jgi:hypothetical protein